MSHVPVMLEQVLAALNLRANGRIIDGTFGAGGYARAILDQAEVALLALDRDPHAAARAQAMKTHYGARFAFDLTPFSRMEAAAHAHGWDKVDGVVLDLGVSSMQIDQAARGFSFMHDGPLDMRMGMAGPSASDAVNLLDADALSAIFRTFGEEKQARRAASAIVRAREQDAITSTGALAALLSRVLGAGHRKIHPATRIFQALRIYINDELGELARALAAAERLLAPTGRLVVVAFHSLEDRLVKQFLRGRAEAPAQGSRHAPRQRAAAFVSSFVLPSRKAQKPAPAQIAANPRARSARLRPGERTNAPAMAFAIPAFTGIPQLSHLQALL